MEQISVGGGILHQTAEEEESDPKLSFKLGLIYDLAEHQHLLFSAGQAFRVDVLSTVT
jgi:hypothetical protein